MHQYHRTTQTESDRQVGLLDDLQPPRKVWPCQIRDTADKLDPKDAEALYAAVANKAWGYQTLEAALKARGLNVGQQSIKKHRLGSCSCSRI